MDGRRQACYAPRLTSDERAFKRRFSEVHRRLRFQLIKNLLRSHPVQAPLRRTALAYQFSRSAMLPALKEKKHCDAL